MNYFFVVLKASSMLEAKFVFIFCVIFELFVSVGSFSLMTVNKSKERERDKL